MKMIIPMYPFLTYVGKRHKRLFKNYDSYIDWLYFELCLEDKDRYYDKVEKDWRLYSTYQKEVLSLCRKSQDKTK